MITHREILQIDATVIAGILILLTISTLGETPIAPQVLNDYIETNENLIAEYDKKQLELFQLYDERDQLKEDIRKIQNEIDAINFKPEVILDEINFVDDQITQLEQNFTKAIPDEMKQMVPP